MVIRHQGDETANVVSVDTVHKPQREGERVHQ
jgi:hypothetical protein